MESAEQLLKRFEKLAYKLTIKFGRGFPKSHKEIKHAALEGLCQGIRDVIDNNKYEYAGAIIYLNIKQKIFEEIRTLPIIPIPSSLVRKKRLECYLAKKPFKINDLYPEVYNDPDLSLISKIKYDGFSYVHFLEIIEELQLTEEEQQVLNLRIEERPIREIAEMIGCSKSQVHIIIKRIRKRWKRKFW